MTTIVEGMDTGATAGPQPIAPVMPDDASLDRLADLLQARMQPTRPAWQTSLLVALASALIAAATTGYFSLRSDIASLGTSLRAEIAAGDASLRAEIAALEENLRAEMTAGDASLRAEIAAVEENLRIEIREFRAEFNRVTLDHTERLTRIEAAHPHPAAP